MGRCTALQFLELTPQRLQLRPTHVRESLSAHATGDTHARLKGTLQYACTDSKLGSTWSQFHCDTWDSSWEKLGDK